MSGQPSKTQAEVNKFRNEYMETLDLQEKINDMNLQANKTYLLTGQLPPQSQMQDTRTNAEKLKDIQMLKIKTAEELRPIADTYFAHQIVDKIINSPLNTDNSLFRFFAQRVSSIVEQLKTLMPYGIAGDENDLEKIVNHIRNMYTSQQNTFQSTKSYMNSLSSGSSKSNIISSNDLDKLNSQFQDLLKDVNIIANRIPRPMRIAFQKNLKTFGGIIGSLKFILPNTREIQGMMEDIINAPIANPYTGDALPEFRGDELSEIFKVLEKLPKYEIIHTLCEKAKSYAKTGNYSLLDDAIKRIIIEFEASGITQPGMMRIIETFMLHLRRQKEKIGAEQNMMETQTRQFIHAQSEEQKNASKAQKVYVINPQTDAVWTRNYIEQPVPQLAIEPHVDEPLALGQPADEPLAIGNGFKRRRGRPRGSGLVKPIQLIKPKTFTGFGINEINQKQLNNGIVKIRRNTKSNYMDMPSKRVSSKLQSIIKTIVGGGVPKFNELNDLDEEDKEYLHKLVSRSNLEDRLSVPAPSKDQQEKDIHNFEVIRGQILSGNDSVELVKKFKLLIRKLSKQGLLPKTDVEDMLETLLQLGY